MCGRYVIYDQLTKGSITLLGHEIPPNFNAAPTAYMPIIRPHPENQEPELWVARWGLIPNWAKNLKIPPFFNARADKLPSNKVFWPSIHQRCLVPMAAFYEWAEMDKQPYFIYGTEEPLLYAAGLWNRWQSKQGETIESYTIITTTPNETLADIHHRMPVFLTETDHNSWLQDDFDQAKNLLQPYSGNMTKYPVNPQTVNNARNNSIPCLDPWKRR
jgi:putative SOS response-associated peptidase YedK